MTIWRNKIALMLLLTSLILILCLSGCRASLLRTTKVPQPYLPKLQRVEVIKVEGMECVCGGELSKLDSNISNLQKYVMRLSDAPCWESIPVGLQP